MEKGRYMLIRMSERVKWFKSITQVKLYVINNNLGNYEFYIIVDTEKDEVVYMPDQIDNINPIN